MTKLTIIGAGNLGGTIGYEIARRGIADELVFVDIVEDLAIGQSNDILQAIAFHNDTVVRKGSYEDIKDSDIVIVTAGKPRTPDIKSRIELGKINAKIVSEIAKNIKENISESIIITVTNPMDIMNYLIQKETGLSRFKVIGSGGMLDSSRFKTVLSKGSVAAVDAFVIGEHGDSQVPVFSRVRINGKKIDFSDEEKGQIKEKLKESALNVIKKKGATIFAPANNTAGMVESILKDQKKLMSCSVVLGGEYNAKGVSIGVPVVLGKNGVEKIEEWKLSYDEKELFDKSVETLKGYINEVLG